MFAHVLQFLCLNQFHHYQEFHKEKFQVFYILASYQNWQPIAQPGPATTVFQWCTRSSLENNAWEFHF